MVEFYILSQFVNIDSYHYSMSGIFTTSMIWYSVYDFIGMLTKLFATAYLDRMCLILFKLALFSCSFKIIYLFIFATMTCTIFWVPIIAGLIWLLILENFIFFLNVCAHFVSRSAWELYLLSCVDIYPYNSYHVVIF